MVSDQAWMQGMTELGVAFPNAAEEREAKALRGSVYRRGIAPYLTDHQWRYAVSEAIRSERWFPGVAVLLDYARSAPPPPNAGLLGAAACSRCDGTGFAPVIAEGPVRVAPCGCRVAS